MLPYYWPWWLWFPTTQAFQKELGLWVSFLTFQFCFSIFLLFIFKS
jgi:hypothetical protein